MRMVARRYLVVTGVVLIAGALLHLVIALGGPDWYAFFGAPRGLVEMAQAGHLRAPLSCLVIATLLSVFAAYALSAAGVIRRLPLLRVVTGLIAVVLLLRGLLFVPLILWRPGSLARICDCQRVDLFIVLTSLLCLALGAGFALAALGAAQLDGRTQINPDEPERR